MDSRDARWLSKASPVALAAATGEPAPALFATGENYTELKPSDR